MRYLLCFLFPPLAVALVGRPLTALLNLLLTLCLVLPGVIHALIVVHSDNAERRHAETLAAITGKPVTMRRPAEWTALGVLVLALMALAVAALLGNEWLRSRPKVKPQAPTLTEPVPGRERMQAAAWAAMQGKSLAEIEGTHGPASSKDRTSGWAEWPKFRARFENGQVTEVGVK